MAWYTAALLVLVLIASAQATSHRSLKFLRLGAPAAPVNRTIVVIAPQETRSRPLVQPVFIPTPVVQPVSAPVIVSVKQTNVQQVGSRAADYYEEEILEKEAWQQKPKKSHKKKSERVLITPWGEYDGRRRLHQIPLPGTPGGPPLPSTTPPVAGSLPRPPTPPFPSPPATPLTGTASPVGLPPPSFPTQPPPALPVQPTPTVPIQSTPTVPIQPPPTIPIQPASQPQQRQAQGQPSGGQAQGQGGSQMQQQSGASTAQQQQQQGPSVVPRPIVVSGGGGGHVVSDGRVVGSYSGSSQSPVKLNVVQTNEQDVGGKKDTKGTDYDDE